jgi:PAS domain S-box-containing protein
MEQNSKEYTLGMPSQSHLAAIVQSSDDAIISKTMDGIIIYWNEGAENVFGYKAKEVIGKNVNIIAARNIDEHALIVKKYLAGEKINHFETQRVKKDKTLIDISLSVSPIYNDKKEMVGFSTIARDITKDKLDRKKSEDKFKGFLESAPDAIVIINDKGEIQLINAQTEKLFGYKRAELIGKEAEMLIPVRYKTAQPGRRGGFFLAPNERSKGAGLNLFGQHKNGAEFPVEISLSPLETEEGLLVSAAIRDITEQKQASQYARSLIEASLDPLVTINADGKITDVNEASVNVTGVLRENLIGTDFSDYFTFPEKAREGYRQVFEKGFVADYPLTVKHSDGKLTDVLYNASVYKDNKGNVLGVFAAARDITIQKQLAKREVVEREKELMRIEELERFRKLTVGRELKMIELKKEIEELKSKISSLPNQ